MKVMYDTLNHYEEVEDRIRSLPFDGVVSPVDNILYPDIALIPDDIGGAIHAQLQGLFPNQTVHPSFQFARLSVEGVEAPHSVHNDLSMGEWTSLFYLCDEGGTDICSHRTEGFGGQPETDELLSVWQRDTNNNEAWHTDIHIPAERNKLVAYPADWMHRAVPYQGYGSKDGGDGRLVIVTFFNLEDKT